MGFHLAGFSVSLGVFIGTIALVIVVCIRGRIAEKARDNLLAEWHTDWINLCKCERNKRLDLANENEFFRDRILLLESAIRTHRDAHGHNRCWLNDCALYRVLEEKSEVSPAMPPLDEFMQRCAEYWAGAPHR